MEMVTVVMDPLIVAQNEYAAMNRAMRNFEYVAAGDIARRLKDFLDDHAIECPREMDRVRYVLRETSGRRETVSRRDGRN